MTIRELFLRLRKDTQGQDLVEYVLLIALLALAVALAFPPVVAAITAVFTRAGAALGG
jgi:Flp pilus assembly pilin Flp